MTSLRRTTARTGRKSTAVGGATTSNTTDGNQFVLTAEIDRRMVGRPTLLIERAGLGGI